MSQTAVIQAPTRSIQLSGILKYSLVVLQLLAVIGVVHLYEIEQSMHLTSLLSLTLVGFLVNQFVAPSLRLPFFGLLSLILLSLVYGLVAMSLVLALGSLVVFTALQVKNKSSRNALLLLILGLLAWLLYSKPWGLGTYAPVLSVLGSMFVFRLSLFLYEKDFEKKKPLLSQEWTYFFMMPNMTMLLFPVVDYKTFLSRYYDEEALKIYKKGVQWVVLGVFHLMVYRFIYYYLLLPPSEVKDALGFWHYASTNYLLIVRLSGLYHISVGILCLFGFNLPRVFDNYFLASGFADLWRRINIYFRDYVIRLFYYPLFFKWRKIGDLRAKVLVILFIFFMTWFLHSLQWFWLRGYFPLRAVDAVFWGLFGILVAGNAIFETGKKKGMVNTRSWGYALGMTSRILGMFVFMSVLWSIWSSNSLQDWWAVARHAFVGGEGTYPLLIGGLASLWVLGVVLYWFFEQYQLGGKIDPPPHSSLATFWSVGMIALLLCLQWLPVRNTMEQWAGVDLEGFLKPKLTAADETLLVEGYYEEILIGNELTSALGSVMERKGAERFRDTEGAILVEDMRIVVAQPNAEFVFKDKLYKTNRLGIRDQEYPQPLREGWSRTAVLGGSYVNGAGVGEEEVFDRILEAELEKQGMQQEFWNFGSSGFDLIQSLYDFDLRGGTSLDFGQLMVVSHALDVEKNAKTFAQVYKGGWDLPYAYMQEIVRKSGLYPEMNALDMMNALKPYAWELVEQSYAHLYTLCEDNNIMPIWLHWPMTQVNDYAESDLPRLRELVGGLGYKIIDLEEVYKDYDPIEVSISSSDRHPNPLGHRLVGEALAKIVLQNPQWFGSPTQD
jgi:hypothetical protein